MIMREVLTIKTEKLREDIVKLLKNNVDRVFYRNASKEVPYPYIVYTLKDIYRAKVLELNIWDYGKDTINIENLADNIEKTLDKEIITNENHSITFYSNEDRAWVDDEDKQVLRIKETFEIRYYGKE